MKRDRRLHGLSSEHHHALVLARRATRAARGEGDLSAEDAWTEVVLRFTHDLLPHFAIEERILLPALRELGEDDLVERTLTEHAAIRRCIASREEGPRERLTHFAELLTVHVRFEERVLFEVAQARLGGDALDAIGEAMAREDAGSAPE